MTHEVVLQGYNVKPGSLQLGTFDSYGIEKIHVTADDEWAGLDILAVFHAPDGTATKVVVGANGMLAVPPEATAKQAGGGRIVFAGLAENVQRITVDMRYSTKPHSDIKGDNPGTPTPDVVQQILENSNHAVSIATAAQDAAENARQAAEDAAKKAGEGAGGAAASAAAAKKSAEDAAASSKSAASKAEESASSASAAAKNAKAAQTAQGSAENAAQTAADAAGDARQAAGEAAQSAEAAETAKQIAEDAAKKALEAKTGSENALQDAGAAKDAASGYADAAAEKATAAAASEKNAANSASAAAKSAEDADNTANSIKDSMTQIAANKEAVSQLKEDLVDFDNEKINKEFLYEIDGSNKQLSSTKIMDVSGNGEIAKVVANSVYRDNLIPIPDIKENTVNGLMYSAVDGIVSVSGTASTFTLIDLGVNLAMMDGINNIGYKIFIFDGTMPSAVSIVLGIAINGFTKTITSTVQENASTGLVTFNGKNIGIAVNNGTAVDFKFGVVIIPVNTIPSKFLNGCKYIGESLDELLCLSNMWAFGNDVSKIFLNTVYRFKKNNLYRKSLFVAGDSVAYGYGSNNISFGEIIAKNNNMRLTKVAISGTTFAKRDGLTNSILEQVESIDKEYDYIIVEGGFNDYFQRANGVSIGTMPKNINSSRDDKTTYGALDSICLWLKQNYPASKILFVVPHKIMTIAGVIDSEFYPYLQAIRDVCEKYSIRYADIALKGGCTPFYQSFRDKYFSGDGIHPNLDGYKTFYVPVIESEMEMM